MLVVMVSAEQQHDTADEHERRQNGFAPVAQHVLNAVGLCASQERNTEQHVCRQFTQNEHQSVSQHEPFVIDLLVNIADRRDAGHQRTRIQYRQQS